MVLTFRPAVLQSAEVYEYAGLEYPRLIEHFFKVWQPNGQLRRSMQRERFPGPDPVPVMRRHLSSLKQPPGYLISDKTDGMRAVLCMFVFNARRIALLIDRKMRLYSVAPIEFPTAAYDGTILDGELVNNKRTGRLQFLVFDVVSVCGTSLLQEPSVMDRLARGYDSLLMPQRPDTDLFELRWKHFFPLEAVDEITHHMQAATQEYEVDGAILTPREFHIKPGSNTGILKFKEGSRNTVDFVVRQGILHVNATRGKNEIKVAPLESGLKGMSDGDIVECELQGGKWHAMRIRTDKAKPNSNDTYTKTLEAIKENLTLADIVR